jgi:hypothetical protein
MYFFIKIREEKKLRNVVEKKTKTHTLIHRALIIKIYTHFVLQIQPKEEKKLKISFNVMFWIREMILE